MSDGNGTAGSMSIPSALTSLCRPTTATATVSSCANEPVMPAGQSGSPDAPRRSAKPAYPKGASNRRATMRAAPLARRTAATDEAIEAASASSNACSSPGEISR